MYPYGQGLTSTSNIVSAQTVANQPGGGCNKLHVIHTCGLGQWCIVLDVDWFVIEAVVSELVLSIDLNYLGIPWRSLHIRTMV